MTSPTSLDLAVAQVVAGLTGRSQFVDLTVQSAINHGVLGGIPFGAALFYWWTRTRNRNERCQVWRAVAAGAVAAALTYVAGLLINWAPPRSVIASAFPSYIYPTVNSNSFPSQSTAVYGAIALGLTGLSRRLAALLLVFAVMLVGLPRMYVGGHYLTDVIAGAAIAVLVALLLPPTWEKTSARLRGMCAPQPHPVEELLMYVAILEVSVGMRELLWVRNGWEFVQKHWLGQ